MNFFELKPSDISNLNDADLREMVARLCEAELHDQKIQRSCILWGGAQEAADGGLDIRVKSEIPLLNPGFVPRKNTGFQIKKSSMGKAACREEMLMRGEVKEVIRSLIEQQGAYIIVSGKDDCSDKMLTDRIKGMQSAIENITSKEQIFLDFYGRDRLSAWLRQYPSVSLWVRSKLGGQSVSGWFPYQRWAGTPKEMDDEFLMDEHLCVTDLNSRHKKPMSIASGINLVREKLGKSGAVIRLIGLSGVGKTRFAQALFEENVGENPLPKTNVIYADLGNEPTPSVLNLVTYLKTNDCTCYVVLDNCPPEIHRTIQKEVSHRAKLSLLTIEYDISDDQPEETEVINIEPSSIRIISKLVLKRFPFLGRVNADKVAEFSGGNARLAIVLASRVEADETLTNFSDEELFRRIFNQRKGKSDGLLESAEILSLVYSFNISSNEYNDELSVLSQIGGSDRKKLYRDRAELFRRQLVQQRGEWLAILPHALANRLARRALQNIHPDQINAELLKANNRRLFKSCAHRLGYLHDFEPAQTLASSWLKNYEPFHDITQCNAEELTILEYIAPIFPNKVLSLIENASISLDFYLRNHHHLKIIVRLLRKLAYEDQYFNRAAELILFFAKSEIKEGTNLGIVSSLAGLFSLFISGTQAKPIQRFSFVEKILDCDGVWQREIAEAIFHSAFETVHWTSSEQFDFGARQRDFGWQPETVQEQLDWYAGFIKLLIPFFDSNDESKISWAEGILAKNFEQLWQYAGCYDVLEDIVKRHGVAGKWPGVWKAIKETIHNPENKPSPEILSRLKELESLAAPTDLYSEIEYYALTNTSDHIELWCENKENKLEELYQKIEKLGELTVAKSEYLKRLAPKLWLTPSNALIMFGKGLAKGSLDQTSTFETLIYLMQQQKLAEVQSTVFQGFITGVYETNPLLSRKLQLSILDVPELKPHFIKILLTTPKASWKTDKLIELTRMEELEISSFRDMQFYLENYFEENELSKLLLAINDLKDGIYVASRLLYLRLLAKTASKKLYAIGKHIIVKLLSLPRDEEHIQKIGSREIKFLINNCLPKSATENEVRNIIDLLCKNVEKSVETVSLTFSYFEKKFINYLMGHYAEYVLDRIFLISESSEKLVDCLFVQDKTFEEVSPINLLSIERVLNWCNGDQNRIQRVASLVSPYICLDKKSRLPEKSKEVTLSPHIKALFDVAEDKTAMVETIFDNTILNKTIMKGWIGSLANILEERFQAFAELLNHPSFEVQKITRDKLIELNKKIDDQRELEAKENSQREQKFE
ncbi:hypothetical protein J3U68_04970 [Snodgrassella sp. B3882]|uniref:hypothetical protein n=1 Tax=Snodgrassella sp. B3882 TaxID=2818037 RepID=UPI00226AC76D|nr:hypothetical protein [Snodgrassella sp. B3882]MCX8744763.1 hypothetical protein [Snodgrassella sp. B3882]